jgi:hypothetical protein
MRIKSMKKAKAISVLLVAFTALLTCKEANAQRGSSYVLPRSAPSNWIVNPANPIYSPRGSRTNPSNNGSYRSNSSSSDENYSLEQKICATRASDKINSKISDSTFGIYDSEPGTSISNAAAAIELKNEIDSCFGIR